MTVVAIVGPTASGKSALAIDVAELINGEIIGTDSMQAYRGMNIGTASPSEAERARVRHHMVDVWDIDKAVSVVEFRDQAREAIEDVCSRDRVPVVVGGSGLYVRAVLEEMDFPGTDPSVRSYWESELASKGAPALHAVLAERDPDAAAAIEPGNGRRIVRALEVGDITGEPFIAQLPDPVDRYPTLRIGLLIDRPELDRRISERVERMWEEDFVDEVRSLPGLAQAPTASAALGYRPILEFLSGNMSEDEAKQATIDDTRRFARRQQRWFTRDERIEWHNYDESELADTVARQWRLASGTS
jgi:tRNA dimethylallyltransferase